MENNEARTFNLRSVTGTKGSYKAPATGGTKYVYGAVLDDDTAVDVVLNAPFPPPVGRGTYRKYPGKEGRPPKLYPVRSPSGVPKAWDPTENAKVVLAKGREGGKMEDTTRQRSIERQVAAKIAAEALGGCEANGPDIASWLEYYKDLVDGVVKVIREDS